MRLKFERSKTRERDVVLIEPDGTVFTSFAKTGYLHATARTRFASGTAAATGAFSISRGQSDPIEGEGQGQANHAQANHGLVFVSEIDGEEKIALIERFASEADARHALALIDAAVRRYVTGRRYGRIWRSLLCWVGAPLLAFVFAMSIVRFLDSHNAAYEELNQLAGVALNNPGALGLPPITLPAASSQANPAAPALAPLAASAPADVGASTPAVPPQARAQAMATIHFGLDNQAPKKTLYVYSDPNCPACRRFESHLDDLAKDFSIYVLPVAYQDGSGKIASQILCATDRKQKWVEAMSRAKTSDAFSGDDCKRGYTSLKANMDSFESLGFDSTPRVVDGDGTVFPAGATANAIRIRTAGR